MQTIFIPGHLCDGRLYAPQIGTRPDAVIADVTRDDSIAAMAARLLDTAPDRFVLAGLSMGGMVAMEVMARAPDRVAGALLMATDPTAARPKEIAWRAGERAKVAEGGLAAFARPFAAMFFAHDQAVAARLDPEVAAMQDAADAALYGRQSDALDGRRDLLDTLSGCPVPVEILAGREDRICPPVLHERLAGVLPQARLDILPGCGHLISLERPQAVERALARLEHAAV